MTSPGRNGPIVVGVDGSEASSRAVRWAADEAQWRHARLRIVHAVEVPAFFYAEGHFETSGVPEAFQAQGEGIVAAAAEEAREVSPGIELETAVLTLSPTGALTAESQTAGMLVLGVTGRSAVTGLLVGSVPAVLAAHARCPVAVIRGRDGDEPVAATGPVVVGVDGGPASTAALDVAFEEASQRGVPLVAAHAWSDADLGGSFSEMWRYFDWEPSEDAERRVLAESLAGWQEKYPDVTVERVAVRDRPRHLLLEWSRKAQLLVVGNRGRGGFASLLLGSTGQALIHHAHSPVLIVRPNQAD